MDATALSHRSLTACAEYSGAAVDLPDDELIARALAGRDGALGQLTERYRGRIYAFALMVLRNVHDAEDVEQDTLLRAFSALHTYRPSGHFRAWLFRIAANLCQDRLRARRGVPLEAVEHASCLAVCPDEHDRIDLREALYGAVGRLPLTYREPVVLHYMEGLSVAETASILGRTQTAVRVQLWRARGLLADEMDGWWKER